MRTLLVEDDDLMRELLAAILESLGHEVVACGDGATAWAAYQEAPMPLVILDLVLPEMGGVELCRRIRSSRAGAQTFVLVVTSRSSPGDLEIVLDAGANDYIAKPVDPQLLQVRLTVAEQQARNLIARSRAESALRDTERHLGAMLSAAPVAIFALDNLGRFDLAEGTFLSTLFGSASIVGRTAFDVLPADAADELRSALEGSRVTSTIVREGRCYEIRYRPRNVSEASSSGIIGVATDVTERRQMEERLSETLAKMERSYDDLLAILNRLKIGTAIADADGHVLFVSQAAQRYFKHPGKEPVVWAKHFGLDQGTADRLRNMIALPESDRERVDIRLKGGDGQLFHMAAEVLDDPGDRQRKVFAFYDMTEVHDLRKMLGDRSKFHDLVGRSEPMLTVYEQIQDSAKVDWTVLIEGETGAGKELVARAIHEECRRSKKPFIAVNCAGLSVSLLQSQLFGHRKGAFTGAIADQPGFFEAAHGGTIFLDEIGDIAKEVQTSLLRVLEEREITRLGESKSRKVDVRIVAATHRNLAEEVEKGNFRADLLYRIRVARISLPPLRERRADIPLLISAFLARSRAASGKPVYSVSDEAMGCLMQYAWPGNVRELKAAIEFAVIRSRGEVLQHDDLPPEIQIVKAVSVATRPVAHLSERERILAALREANGNRSTAAQIMGVSRATFYRRLDKYSIDATQLP